MKEIFSQNNPWLIKHIWINQSAVFGVKAGKAWSYSAQKMQSWSHLLRKSLIKNFIFVQC